MKYFERFSKLSVFSKAEIIGEFRSARSADSILFDYVRRGLIVKVRQGLYAAVNPATGQPYAGRYEIATKTADDAYVAYHSALEYHGIANQVFNTVYFCSSAEVRPFESGGVMYSRLKPPKASEGIITAEVYSIVRVTDLERSVVDCVNRLDLAGGVEELITAINACAYLDENKLKKYLDEYGEKYLYQKAGYLLWLTKRDELSQEFFLYCKERTGNRRSYMTENSGEETVLNTEWNLIVPKTLNGGN
jgi:predicted transcriptional regulator of viral defense system